MSQTLYEISRRHQPDLVERVDQRLSEPGHPHYERLPAEQRLRRVGALVEAFVASLPEGAHGFVTFVEKLAEQRVEEGYFLAEMQSTLSVLEERAWELVVAEVPLEEQVSCLARVTSIVCSAKDALARIFLAHQQRAEKELARLEARFETLLTGTISSEIREDEL
jgi:hypothetical protein